jgi:autoinducer 2-degrading protein
MLIVQVNINIKPEFIEQFLIATIDNARNSIKEPGIARFDVLQEHDDPSHFLLIEVYRDEDAPARHKETTHYALWRDTVKEMEVEPRTRKKYINVFPLDAEW